MDDQRKDRRRDQATGNREEDPLCPPAKEQGSLRRRLLAGVALGGGPVPALAVATSTPCLSGSPPTGWYLKGRVLRVLIPSTLMQTYLTGCR